MPLRLSTHAGWYFQVFAFEFSGGKCLPPRREGGRLGKWASVPPPAPGALFFPPFVAGKPLLPWRGIHSTADWGHNGILITLQTSRAEPTENWAGALLATCRDPRMPLSSAPRRQAPIVGPVLVRPAAQRRWLATCVGVAWPGAIRGVAWRGVAWA